MKVNTSLCMGNGDFSPKVHVFANTLVPIVSTAHLVVQWLIGITRLAHTLGTTRTYP